MFWTPAFAGVTLQETFYEIIKVGGGDFSGDLEEGQLEKSFGLQVSNVRFSSPNSKPATRKILPDSIFPLGS
jgi:hypothetical protein